jgi:hypothetical protein
MFLLLLLLLLLQIMVLDKDKELRWKDYRGMIFSQFFRCASLHTQQQRQQTLLVKATGVQQSGFAPIGHVCSLELHSAACPCSCTQLLRLCMPAPAAAAAPCRHLSDGCTQQRS